MPDQPRPTATDREQQSAARAKPTVAEPLGEQPEKQPQARSEAPPEKPSKAYAEAHPLAGRIAAPSFVIPAGVGENARFLAGRVDEVGLCLFETRACLNYGPADLPPDLTALPLRWHAHLPTDLPWPTKSSAVHPARTAARLALAVLDRAAFLQPGRAVLHPPEGSPQRQRRLLAGFAHHWKKHSHIPLLLENVKHSDIHGLGQDFLQDHGLGLCLDVGHLLGYGQKNLLFSSLPEQAALVHWSAPGDGDRHLPLTALTEPQLQIATALMARFASGAVHLAEIFNWKGLASSLPVLDALAQPHLAR